MAQRSRRANERAHATDSFELLGAMFITPKAPTIDSMHKRYSMLCIKYGKKTFFHALSYSLPLLPLFILIVAAFSTLTR